MRPRLCEVGRVQVQLLHRFSIRLLLADVGSEFLKRRDGVGRARLSRCGNQQQLTQGFLLPYLVRLL